jgi:hypothetical protein
MGHAIGAALCRASSMVALARRPTQRDVRLASGLVLFGYVTSHPVNHTLGLISIDVAERGLALGVRVCRASATAPNCRQHPDAARPAPRNGCDRISLYSTLSCLTPIPVVLFRRE